MKTPVIVVICVAVTVAICMRPEADTVVDEPVVVEAAAERTDKPLIDDFLHPDLVDREARRAYHGAPPVIPHRAKYNGQCMACHTKAMKFKSFSPWRRPIRNSRTASSVMPRECDTPHPEEASVTNGWAGLEGPKQSHRAHVVAPPTIPHGLHMRENCATCHAADHPDERVRCDHLERTNCQQCHVAAPVLNNPAIDADQD